MDKEKGQKGPALAAPFPRPVHFLMDDNQRIIGKPE